MQAGRLRERVNLQSFTTSRGTAGSVIESWATEATFWAQVIEGSVNERFSASAGQRASEITHTIRARWRTDVTPVKRLQWGTRILEILGQLDPDGRTRTLVIMCKEELTG